VGAGGGGGVEELAAREEELAVELEDFVEFGRDVGADDVFDADAGGLDFAGLGERSTMPSILLSCGCLGKGSVGRIGGDITSRSWAISRRCCLAFAASFCCTMRRRDMESLSCTLSLFCGVLDAWSLE
jgi:hypothetical protein